MRRGWDDLNDPYDSPGYYQDSAPYNRDRWRFTRPERKPKPVDTAPNLRQAFRLERAGWTLAHEANAAAEEGYRALTIPANHLVWRAKCWDINERELVDCYMTKIDGKVWYFSDVSEKETPLLPVSVARAIFMQITQGFRDNR